MYKNNYFEIEMGQDYLFRYLIDENLQVSIQSPSFEVDNENVVPAQKFIYKERNKLNENIEELTYSSILTNNMNIDFVIRVSDKSPIIRFKYVLYSNDARCLTKHNGLDNIVYCGYETLKESKKIELRISDYDYMYHTHVITENEAFNNENQIMGPILVEEREDLSLLLAYEHGSQYPNKFLEFEQEGNKISVKSIKGNYVSNQLIDSNNNFETIWFQFGAVKGGKESLAKQYRTFQLKYCTLNMESRKPYIFYNTWNFQERNKRWNGNKYLTDMTFERMDKEIDAANQMGIEVFVIDTGWYKQTGDWLINEEKFPDKLKLIKKKLDSYGMKLGIWFNPIAAGKTSEMYLSQKDNIINKRDSVKEPHEIWETEESYEMCLVSGYWKRYASRLCEIIEDLGVSYIKWDAVGMEGCQQGNHYHGTSDNSSQECEENYSFNVVRYLVKIIDYVCEKHPEVIFDFDITEPGRCTGLGFLSSGKYFAINNGPYFDDYNIKREPDTWSNIFVNPGPARTWISRRILDYDKWIPSVLFLTHYLPDDGYDSQLLNIASLILGQNGIWGDLLNISKEGVSLFNDSLSTYKEVRDDITEAYPIMFGRPGETFEVHEKISENTGRGAVVLFTNSLGEYTYKLKNKTTKNIKVFGNAVVEFVDEENVSIKIDNKTKEAAIVFFK
ncbi:alpha-galactosidase [Clostridium sp. HCS.1]|uniref:alpha-galactosidase n=1 Tax=Clostridium sp. HCS.1 TaxID=3238594 RepID=UPI003A100E3A